MTSHLGKQRFAELAERELHAGPRREPLWQQVLAATSNDPAQAEDLYRQRRVEELLADEESFAAAQKRLTAHRRLNDELVGGVARNNGLFGLGIVLVLLACLIWFLRR